MQHSLIWQVRMQGLSAASGEGMPAGGRNRTLCRMPGWACRRWSVSRKRARKTEECAQPFGVGCKIEQCRGALGQLEGFQALGEIRG